MATLRWSEQKTLPTSTMSAGNEVVLLFRYMKPCSSRVSLASFTNVLWLVTSRRVHGVTSQRTSVTLGGDQYFMALWWAYLPDSAAAYNCLLSNCYICLMIFSPQSKNSEDTTQDYCILTSCKKFAWTGVLTPSFSFCSCAILCISFLNTIFCA